MPQQFMKKLVIGCVLSLLVVSGCTTSVQLKDNTLNQGETLPKLENQMVLDNIAMFWAASNSLPWHMTISKASVTINDIVTPSGGYKGGPPVRTVSVSMSRAWQGDWTFTPIVDTNILKTLQSIYQNIVWTNQFEMRLAGTDILVTNKYKTNILGNMVLKQIIETNTIRTNWINVGQYPPKSAAMTASYGATCVWVDQAGLAQLSAATMNVMQAAGQSTIPWLEIKPGQVDQWLSMLQASSTNKDLASQFILNQIPASLKLLVSNYNSSSTSEHRPGPWFKGAFDSGLNKTIDGWTTNEVYQFIASIEMTDQSKLLADLRNRLSQPMLPNDLLELTIEQMTNYYSSILLHTNKPSPVAAPNMYLIPGAANSIR